MRLWIIEQRVTPAVWHPHPLWIYSTEQEARQAFNWSRMDPERFRISEYQRQEEPQ